MVSLPRFLTAESGDPSRARERLSLVREGPPPPTVPDGDRSDADLRDGHRSDADLPDGHPLKDEPTGQAAPADQTPSSEPPAGAREGRLVRWWVPGPLRDARWEPGRPGALMLSLVAALAAVIAAVGVWRDRPVPVPAPALPLVAADGGPSAVPAPQAAPELVISVVGLVARPGLVRLPDGARVADALEAVGGALPGTDLLGLNLARRLTDGEQLLVGVPPPPGQQVESGVLDAPAGPAALVDLNTATLEQLDTLPGVGPVTAQRILDWRAAHGRFRSVEQLREVSGIGESRFAQLKDLVRV